MAKILVVDDAFFTRKNLIQILTNAGHNVVGEASNGIEALTQYEKLQPDLVTMDITMRVLDGISTVKQIIVKYPDARIVMISSINQKEQVFEALKNGAKHYIIKPFTPEKVTEVINTCLRI